MKRTRKGFTLLELLVVIGVMGILSSTAMIAGQQATDAARATNIADGLEKAASAMMMYYADNADDISKNGLHQSTSGKSANAILAEGANAYLKKSSALVDTAAEGKYSVAIINAAAAGTTSAAAQEWWVVYTLPATDTAGIGPILKNKTSRMELKKEVKADAEDYDGEATVAMKVRGTTPAATTTP